MDPFKVRKYGKDGPEAKIQQSIIDRLKSADWYVKVMIGNAFQFGIPDLFVAHPHFGQRFIEVKNPLRFSFTPAQLVEFPKLKAAGVGIWILFSAEDDEIMKLMKPANWVEVYLQWQLKKG